MSFRDFYWTFALRPPVAQRQLWICSALQYGLRQRISERRSRSREAHGSLELGTIYMRSRRLVCRCGRVVASVDDLERCVSNSQSLEASKYCSRIFLLLRDLTVNARHTGGQYLAKIWGNAESRAHESRGWQRFRAGQRIC